VVGWPRQADFLRAKYDAVPLWKRKPAAAWRGRTQDPEHPWRDELRYGSCIFGAANQPAIVRRRRQCSGDPSRCGLPIAPPSSVTILSLVPAFASRSYNCLKTS
jgi:hypothetical protein